MIVGHYAIGLGNILILHDDLDNKFASVKLKKGGSSNGHNGVKSIISTLGTNNFHRLRLGIGRPSDAADVEDYVLSKFTSEQVDGIEQVVCPKVWNELIKWIV